MVTLGMFILWLSGQQAVGLVSGGFVMALWVADSLTVGYRPHQLCTHFFATLSGISLSLVKLFYLEYAVQATGIFWEERKFRVSCQ